MYFVFAVRVMRCSFCLQNLHNIDVNNKLRRKSESFFFQNKNDIDLSIQCAKNIKRVGLEKRVFGNVVLPN